MISLIAAIQKKDRGIGYKNELLFMISDDLKRFKTLTSGHPIIMGRKTFESIGRPLPNRTNIVISRQPQQKDGVVFCTSLEEAIVKAKAVDENIFVIGGAEIYKLALPYADRLELTVVESEAAADTFFPEYDDFKKVISQKKYIDEKTNLSYEWVTLEK